MKIRFGRNDVLDTKALEGLQSINQEDLEIVVDYAYVPEEREYAADWLDQFIGVCNKVSSGGEKPIEMTVGSDGSLKINAGGR